MKNKRGFEPVSENMRKNRDVVPVIPARATQNSAGYDFICIKDIDIPPQGKTLVWTDVKVFMEKDEMLILDVRSSAGTKLDLALANTLGIVDSDYFNNAQNEGNIGICIRNMKPAFKMCGFKNVKIGDSEIIAIPIIEDMTEENTVHIKAGEKIAQGIIIKFLKADGDETEAIRSGGFGHSGK